VEREPRAESPHFRRRKPIAPSRRVISPRFAITYHALGRFVERHPELDDAGSGEIRRLLLEELERGIPYGYQLGRDELYLLPSGLVAAVVWDEGLGVVKTVLTREHANAGMESMGAVLKRAGCLAMARRRPAAGEASEPDPLLEATMRELAEKHLSEGLSRKRRNALLREAGYDPAGYAGDVYRAARKAQAETDRNRAS
jgi:hypothetical protein